MILESIPLINSRFGSRSGPTLAWNQGTNGISTVHYPADEDAIGKVARWRKILLTMHSCCRVFGIMSSFA